MTNTGLMGMSPLQGVEEINLPCCEFRLFQNPSECLKHEAIDGLWRIGKGIFDEIRLDVREGEYFCNSKADMIAPESHRQLLWNLVFYFGDKWEAYLNNEYEPSKSESDAFCIMERLLLEGAFYLAWNVKNMKKGLMPMKYYLEDDDDFGLGLVLKENTAIEEAVFALMYGKTIDYETRFRIISTLLVSLGS